MNTVEKVKIFEKELEKIKNNKVKVFLEEAIKIIPDDFFKAPASTSGKNHPVDERGVGGMVLHTKRMFWACEMMSTALDLYEYDSDILKCASILHDSLSKEYVNGKYRTVKIHELMPRNHFKTLRKNLTNGTYNTIMNLIESHSGKYSPHPKFIPKETELLRWAFHWCDYFVSRREVIVNIETDSKCSICKCKSCAKNLDNKCIEGSCEEAKEYGVCPITKCDSFINC